jgi:hypothetical protein
VHLLLEQKFVKLRVFTAVQVTNQIVEVLPDQLQAYLRGLFSSECIIDIEDGDDKASVLLGHVLD